MESSRFNYYWRFFGTAFSFFVFGLGGITIPLIAVPILYCVSTSRSQREQRTQKLIHHAFRAYIGMMRILGVLSYEISGVEKLKSAQLILANHPTLIDVIFLIALVPNANCVVKRKLLQNPFTAGPVRAAGYITNDEAGGVIEDAALAFKKGYALIVFPEGTRSSPGQPITLKRGAANIAVRTAADITPVLIECEPRSLSKEHSWYHTPNRKIHFRIRIEDPIRVNKYANYPSQTKSVRALTGDLTEYFQQKVLAA